MVRLPRHRRFASSFAPLALSLLAGAFALGMAPSCAKGGGSTTGTHNTGGHASTSTAGSSTGGAPGTGGAGGTGGVAPKPCAADKDCAGNPVGALCDTATGHCVSCLPASDACAAGQFCDPATHACAAGCKGDPDCATDAAGPHCDPVGHTCVACLTEGDCPAGQICTDSVHVCVPGCSATHACSAGATCCGAVCHDLATDLQNCGMCGKPCALPANATGQCAGGVCQIKACLPAFADCDGDMTDGCEQNTLEDGPCTCAPGATQSCYQGSPGTLGVGPCKAGTQTCGPSGTSWGPCVGQIIPVSEICNNNVDDDCNGAVDDIPDLDGDGWTVCDGDCCDVAGPNCTNPALVNPGAFEVAGDGVDNDCDGTVDNVAPTNCSTAAKFTGVTGVDVANAMDLCQFTTASPPLAMKKWGVISATQVFANGATPTAAEVLTFQNKQTAIKTEFGTGGVVPKKGATLAAISTGMARATADPGWLSPNPGSYFNEAPPGNTSISFPGGGALATYVNAHGGGLLPGKCGTSTCPVGVGANDSINIRLQIRVPTNAQGFSYDFRLYSAEYYTYQCSSFNDYYLASLTSGVAGTPTDHNISFDALHNAVSVNNGFFQDCGGNGKGCGPCPYGTASLAGTGFDQVVMGKVQGGSTEWLTTDSPIVPGETMILELMVFDVGDHALDTMILLDNFRWSLTPVTLGTHT